jgi:hypothetical protein
MQEIDMAVKIHYPKKNGTHKHGLLIVQGVCDNVAKITVELKNKTANQMVAGQPLGTGKQTCWAYRYQNLPKGDYELTLSQTNSPVETDTVPFSTDPPAPLPPGPPQPGAVPLIMSPLMGPVATVFFSTGTSGQPITQCTLSCSGQADINALGTVQGPDSSGAWSAQIDASNYPPGSGNCTLTVANATGPSMVMGLSLP